MISRKIITALFFFTVSMNFLGCDNTRKADNMSEESVVPRYTVVVKNGYRYFDAELVSPRRVSIGRIFSVPKSNAVGILEAKKNAAAYLTFGEEGKNPRLNIIAANYSKYVFDEEFIYSFSPNFSDDIVAYSKTRVAVILNLKTRDAFHVGFGMNALDEGYILGVRMLDPQNNLFVVEKAIVEQRKSMNSPWVSSLHIAKLDLKKRKFEHRGEIIPRFKETTHIVNCPPAYNDWVIHGHTVIVHNNYTRDMQCFNDTEKVTHPFAEIFNRNKDKIQKLRDFVVHPELPFGFAVEHYFPEIYHLSPDERDKFLDNPFLLPLHLIRWNTDDPDEQFTTISPKFLPLIPHFEGVKHLAFAYPSFSPDGKWFVVGCFQNNLFHSPYFIAIPVNTQNPEFLNMDELVVLGRVENISSIAWSSNPTAFVVSEGSRYTSVGSTLHKWDLGEIDNARVITVPIPNNDGEDDDDEDEKTESRKNIIRRFLERLVWFFKN